jgi:hypothetical protein
VPSGGAIFALRRLLRDPLPVGKSHGVQPHGALQHIVRFRDIVVARFRFSDDLELLSDAASAALSLLRGFYEVLQQHSYSM